MEQETQVPPLPPKETQAQQEPIDLHGNRYSVGQINETQFQDTLLIDNELQSLTSSTVSIPSTINTTKSLTLNSNIFIPKTVPLPEHSKLLNSEEIIKLNQDTHKLNNYINQLHKNSKINIIEEINIIKKKFQDLEVKFNKLDIEKNEVLSQKLSNLQIIESTYIKKLQDFNSQIHDQYSNESMKKKLEKQIREIDEESEIIERNITKNIESSDKDQTMDEMIDKFLDSRCRYHLRAQKLATWNVQGNLKV
ncbi:hypothetical protein TBLA_0H01300 [Henningerozyma blattae CBS 6284]|uniref:VPS37 C-terminal domain-containing protein n=1 Tax=Henningerozyma blattae (strain ATCC 34711 / CBS 6284 / DSM 70876 / NBRC 10599 / NRRL Y-10934 / UCD 77-7) TaxID=1071380 RepID=I2H7R5_HENB6|nr:hypothetical protein TBLA_0H01300 [Tetrapisispora blattae CBS 6284]CCH62417.1 hypothetical protein TBLA_0H01300 [Tetrapisispora blattae CBS 6284]